MLEKLRTALLLLLSQLIGLLLGQGLVGLRSVLVVVVAAVRVTGTKLGLPFL